MQTRDLKFEVVTRVADESGLRIVPTKEVRITIVDFDGASLSSHLPFGLARELAESLTTLLDRHDDRMNYDRRVFASSELRNTP